MTETFTNIYRLLTGGPRPTSADTESCYSTKELNFLLVWRQLERISKNESIYSGDTRWSRDDTYFHNKEWSNDLKSLFDSTAYNRTVGRLNLAAPMLVHRCTLDTSTPHLFDGHLEIKQAKIPLRTYDSKIKLSLVSKRYRYCVLRSITEISVNLRDLKGFGKASTQTDSQVQTNTAANITVQYRRNFDNLMPQAVETKYILVFLKLTNITPEVFISRRIEAFLNGDCGTQSVLSAMRHFYKAGNILGIEVAPLLAHLEMSISSCHCDSTSYELYRYLGFLMKTKRIPSRSLGGRNSPRLSSGGRKHSDRPKESIFDPEINSVITQDPELPSHLFRRLSSKILEYISGIDRAHAKHNKLSTVKIYGAFRFYASLKIPLNSMFIHKFFLISSGGKSQLDGLLEMCLLGPQSTVDADECLKWLWKLFMADLSDTFKICGDVQELYRLVFECLGMLAVDTKVVMALFDGITHVHRKYIEKTKELADLKVIHSSMSICEKSLGLRNDKTERVLKKKVADLLKKP